MCWYWEKFASIVFTNTVTRWARTATDDSDRVIFEFLQLRVTRTFAGNDAGNEDRVDD